MPDLRSMIAGALLAAAVLGLPAPAGAQEALNRTQAITGAGSTFAFPVLQRWAQAFQKAQGDNAYQPVGAALDYEPSGSQAGVMRLREAAVDFGATDVPLGSEELSRYGVGQFPFVIGGVVAAANVAGVPDGRLRLSGELLADIYSGRINTWSDGAVKALNPDLTLPDAPIVVVRRSDGSGTTFNFTSYLSKLSPRWKAEIGEGLLVRWPSGLEAKGNDGMAETIRRTPNSLGYLDLAQARRAGLNVAQLRNAAGRFVTASPDSFRAAAASAEWAKATDFNLAITDAPGAEAWPIVATVFAVLPKQRPPSKRQQAAFAFFRWSLDEGARAAEDLGYVPLPPALVEQVVGYWGSTFGVARGTLATTIVVR